MTSPGAVLDLIRREQTPAGRYAIVTNAAAGPPVAITVRFIEGGDTFQPDVIGLPSLPAVGARCLILPVSGRWVFAGVVTAPSTAVDYRTLDVPLVNNWDKSEQVDGSWGYQQDRMATGIGEYSGAVQQGRWTPQQGSTDNPVPTNPPTMRRPTVLFHNVRAALNAVAAAAGTVHMVELAMRRSDAFSAPFVSPVMRGHTYTTASPPVVGSPPTWSPGFGPLRLSPLASAAAGCCP